MAPPPAIALAQRREAASIDANALEQMKRFVSLLHIPATYQDGDDVRTMPPAIAKQFWDAGEIGSGEFFEWQASTLEYLRNGQAVDAAAVKGAAECVVQEGRFLIQDATLKLQQATQLKGKLDLADLRVWEMVFDEHVKNIHGAAHALAFGGWDHLAPADLRTVEEVIAREYAFRDGFRDRILNGYYGPQLDRRGILNHSGQYASAARSTYENSRASAGMNRLGHDKARRLTAATEHCEDCLAWAALGWIDIAVMMEKYPIGASRCHANCYCVIITGNTGNLTQ